LNKTNTIQVFEYQSLHYGKEYAGVLFRESHFQSLVKLNVLHDNAYFTVIHKGIKFKQFVGVIQVDGLVIEILPKIDAASENPNVWRDVLIQMLRVTKKLKVNKVGQAQVQRQQIHLLDIYFEWYLSEIRLLIRQGLIKQYFKETKNVNTLKGRLEFAGHIQKNLVHKERFYTTHQVYEHDHLIHQILGMALDIVAGLSKGKYLYAPCKTVQLDFPEVKKVAIHKSTFSKIPVTRKTAPYKTALEIARLIILNYAPNIASGAENMLALLFDMNALWEEYVLVRLRHEARKRPDVEVMGQNTKTFWNGITIRPDVVIKKGNETFVLDTKWKNIDNYKPSTEDLRQMYVYNDYWTSHKAMLLYPAHTTRFDGFKSYEALSGRDTHHQCSLGRVSIFDTTGSKLNDRLGELVLEGFEDNGV